MSSVVIGPQTARRLLAIYAPHVRLEDVPALQEVPLGDGVRLAKSGPLSTDVRAHKFGDEAYIVYGQDAQSLIDLGLDPEPELPREAVA